MHWSSFHEILAWFLSKKLGKDYKAQHGVAIALGVLSVALTFLVIPMFVLAPAGVMLSVVSWIKFKRQMDQKGETEYWITGLLNAIPLLCTTSIVSFQVYIFHTARWN
jgi:ABC-type dipeptide/oligopeptide/nickel transport system permease component